MITCGIDIGTTNLKVVLVDAAGNLLQQATRAAPRIDEDGAPVTNPHDLMATIEAMIFEVWRQNGAAEPLSAISTAGVGEDGLLTDAELLPVSNALPWFDRRAAAEADELEAAHSAQALTGLTFEPTRTAPKWLWLSRNRHYPPDAIWITLTDLPLAIWSGRPFISETLAARTACYDVARRRWIPELLAASSAPALPEVLPATAIVGHVRSERLLQSGVASRDTVLVAGGHDHPVAASFVRKYADDAIVDSIGTAELIYAETGSYTPMPRTGLVHSPAILETGGQALTYVFELTRVMQPVLDLPGARELIEEAARGTQAPSAEPWLPSGRAIEKLRADLETDAAGRLSLIRSVLEGCSFVTRSVIEEMRQAGVAGGQIYCSGGRSRSDVWMGLRASVLGMPVHRMAQEEQAALGAALIALSAVADGLSDIDGPTVDTFAPDPVASEAFTARYRPCADALRALRAPPHPPLL